MSDGRGLTEDQRMAKSLAAITRREAFARTRKLLARQYKHDPNWVLAMKIFGLGSTYAFAICEEMGLDPEACIATPWPNVVGRAALAERGGSEPSPNRPVVPEERSDG